MNTVSAYVPAYNAADRLPALIDALRAFADEVVVAVDERSSDGTAEIARERADQVSSFTHDGTFARIFEEQFRCRGDWIVRFDDDETPSPGWTRGRVAELAADAAISHYYFAGSCRRAIVTSACRRFGRTSRCGCCATGARTWSASAWCIRGWSCAACRRTCTESSSTTGTS
jgi:glycosyltransferase involved in cell wall biosynthesis